MSTMTKTRQQPAAAGEPGVLRDPAPASPGDAPADPAEVLIKEARRRQRRRWAFSLLALMAAAGLVAGLLASSGSPPPPRDPHLVHEAHSQPPQGAPVTPAVTASSTTGLVGGEQVHVSLHGFPANVGVQVSECPSTAAVGRSGCVGAGAWLVTDATGSASGTLVAHPSAQATATAPPTVCTSQCVLAAVESLKFVTPISATPVTATVPIAFEPQGVGGLADSQLVGLSWVSPEHGVALARQPCGKGVCAVVARTTDGGGHWRELPATPALVAGTTGCTALQCANGVHHVVFATPAVGYLYGPGMFTTADGGRHWRPVPGPEVAALGVGDGQVFRVVYTHSGCPGPCTTAVQAAPVGTTAWHTVLTGLPDATIGGLQVLVSGSDVYVAGYGDLAQGAGTRAAILYRSVDGGAAFAQLADPCAGKLATAHVLTALAAAPGGVLDGICSPRAGTGTQYLASSTDAGSSFQPLRAIPGRPPGVGEFGTISAASASTVAVSTGPVSGAGTQTAKLIVTTDGGATWTAAATDTHQLGTVAAAQLGFVSARAGWWVAAPHDVFTTTDGGAHWARRPFGSATAGKARTSNVDVTPSTSVTAGGTGGTGARALSTSR